MPTLEELRKDPHWSYSALNTYLNICQMQYFYRYVEHAPVERIGSCLPFGRAMHNALSLLAVRNKANVAITHQELSEAFAEYFKAETTAAGELLTYKPKESYDGMIATGSDMLKAAMNEWHAEQRVVSIAHGFSVSMPCIAKPVVGEFDLLVIENKIPCIVDWKTASQKWPMGKADKDLQATLYSYAYKQMHEVNPLVRFDVITKTKTPSVESQYTTRSDDDHLRLEYTFKKVDEAVAKGVFLPSETSFSCGDCPYADRCKTYHKSHTIRPA